MLLPGDAADIVLGQAASEDARAAFQATLHLDEAAPVRYGRWLLGADYGFKLCRDDAFEGSAAEPDRAASRFAKRSRPYCESKRSCYL
jgi:hypothetical protein